ncbi:hypothetical protein H1R20_g3607, partial [Candolleomyces eurysporus]
MSLSAARLLSSSITRQLRVSSIPRTVSRLRPSAPIITCQRRSLFGNWGKSSQPADISEADAQERIKAVTEAMMKNEQWKKVANHPGSLEALRNLMEVLMKNGINMGSGQQPGLSDMIKLARNTEFRDAVVRVKTEMKAAGFDLEDPELMKSLMSIASPPPKP